MISDNKEFYEKVALWVQKYAIGIHLAIIIFGAALWFFSPIFFHGNTSLNGFLTLNLAMIVSYTLLSLFYHIRQWALKLLIAAFFLYFHLATIGPVLYNSVLTEQTLESYKIHCNPQKPESIERSSFGG